MGFCVKIIKILIDGNVMASDQPKKTPSASPKKIRKTWLIWAVLLAVLVVLFLTFRPVADEELVEDDGEVKVYEPVVYDTATWQKAADTSSDIEELKAQLGSTATTEEALDFHGKRATRYRFSAPHESPFYVIESQEFLEVVWYYAAPTDDEATKAQSIDFAKRGYRMMSMLDPNTGAHVVHQILQGVAMGSQRIGALGLEQADCQDYRCQIILHK